MSVQNLTKCPLKNKKANKTFFVVKHCQTGSVGEIAYCELHFFQIKPLMKSNFQNILYTGGLGTAMIPKVFSNMLAAVNIVAAGEIMMVAKKAGLDMKTFWDCIRSSSGNSFVWETGVPMVMQGTYDPSFHVGLHCKDNQLCFDIAKTLKVWTFLSENVRARALK
jgi:3-hydroxyisobutyrate dehydrogenase-like beta-hydroxyacid dehydrogenase